MYLLDVDVLLQMWCSYDQDTKALFEEGDIGNGDYGLRGMGVCNNICVSNTGSDPVLAFLILLGMLISVRLSYTYELQIIVSIRCLFG